MKKILIPILTLAATIFCGCTSTPHVVNDNSNFVLMDAAVQRSIAATGIQQAALPDGRMKLAANIRNLEARRIQVQINCEFKDEQGFTIDATPWQTLILTENGQETVPFESANAQAKKYTIRVREAR